MGLKLAGDGPRTLAQLSALQPIVCPGLPASDQSKVLHEAKVPTGAAGGEHGAVAGRPGEQGFLAGVVERRSGAGVAGGEPRILEAAEAGSGGTVTNRIESRGRDCSADG